MVQGYFAARKLVLNEELPLPPFTKNLAPAEHSRLNRLILSHGLIYLWWDSEEEQQELAKSFIPLKMSLHVLDTAPDKGKLFTGKERKQLLFAMDDLGISFYPERSAREYKAYKHFDLLACVIAKYSGGTEQLRPLRWREAALFRKLHDLPKKALELTLNTGFKKYPSELREQFLHFKETQP